MKNKKGFTLMELLAVIVILAIILIIAVPIINTVIENSRVSSLEVSAKLVASSLEKNYEKSLVSGEEFDLTGDCLITEELDTNLYSSCTYTITNGKATITLTGKSGSKFDNYVVSNGTKTEANAIYGLVCNDGYRRVGTTKVDSNCVLSDFTISFNSNGGDEVTDTKVVTYDSVYGELPTPSYTGHSFVGWYTKITGGNLITSDSVVKLTSDTTLYAIWDVNKYTVTLNAGSGTIPVTTGWTNSSDNKTSTKEITYNEVYGDLPIPTKTGYTFDGWYKDELYTNKIESDSLLVSTINHMLYAKWTPNTYTITLNKDGGECADSVTVVYDSTYSSLPTPTKTGYTFLGWYTLGTGGDKIENTEAVKITSDTTLYAHWVYTTNVYDYTGSYQTFTTLVSGTYKLEVWGSQGGTDSSLTDAGNYGGYSTGYISLNKDDVLYIYVGSKGANYQNSTPTNGGYNGGGAGGAGSQGGSSGGGATHIATTSGLLSTLSNNISSILIVAGGGGGTGLNLIGGNGAGGGYIGNSGGYVSNVPNYYCTGGSQTQGGRDNAEGSSYAVFGQGQGYINSSYGGHGGGGGFYGGGGSSRGHSGAGGGSGYIGNSNLSNKAMYCYNCSTSNDTNTKTISTTCASDNPTSNCSKKGNGYAKITFVSLD